MDKTSSPTFVIQFPDGSGYPDSSKSYAESTIYIRSFLDFDLESVSLSSPEPYDRAITSGKIALVGVGISIVFSIFCIASGVFLAFYRHTIGDIVIPDSWRNPSFSNVAKVFNGVLAILPARDPYMSEILSLLLNLLIMICTESIGFVHGVSLKSALASESRLHFNTNLRLITATRGKFWANANSTFYNAIMSILLILSYVSGSLIFLPFWSQVTDHAANPWWSTCIFAVPVIVLGSALLLQAVIALAGIRSTKILTWSSSAFDATAALIHSGQLIPTPGQCMRGVFHPSQSNVPQLPSKRQPSAWQAHSSVKKIVIFLWCLPVACAACGGITLGIWYSNSPKVNPPSWAITLNPQTSMLGFNEDVDPERGYPWQLWLGCYIVYTMSQGALTLGLHCSEVIINIVRDEANWRMATSKVGTDTSQNPLKAVLRSWLGIALLITKPLLHWAFGHCLYYGGFATPIGTSLAQIQVAVQPVQFLYLSIPLCVFSFALTLVARHQPYGPQPAAYGHLQTLANLVDEWSPRMWWGHKQNGSPIGHAGTSNHKLPPVNMETLYAGVSTDSQRRDSTRSEPDSWI